MKLERLFATLLPYLEGRVSHAQVVEQLYPPPARTGPDAARIAVYAGIFGSQREYMVGALFPHCKRHANESLGHAVWHRVARDYFLEHPNKHFAFVESVRAFPVFVTAHATEYRLPVWLGGLADVELWSRIVVNEERSSGDPDSGPVRLTAGLEIRRYDHDFVEWLRRDDAARAEPPRPAPGTIVAFWRGRSGMRRANAGRDDLLAVRLVRDAQRDGAFADRWAAAAPSVRAALKELRRQLLVVGDLSPWVRGVEHA
jgi:hypothetical protein